MFWKPLIFLRPREIEVIKFRNSNESPLKRPRPSCLRIVNRTNGKENIESKHKPHPHNKWLYECQEIASFKNHINSVRATFFMSNREEKGREKGEVACLWWGSLPLLGVRGCWQEKSGCRLSLPLRQLRSPLLKVLTASYLNLSNCGDRGRKVLFSVSHKSLMVIWQATMKINLWLNGTCSSYPHIFISPCLFISNNGFSAVYWKI